MRARVLAPLLMTALLLTGCTSGGGDSTASSAAGGAAAAPAAAPPAKPAAAAVEVPRSVVRTASLEVQVEDVRAAADRAAALARGAGGGLEAEDSDRGEQGSTGGTTTLRLRVDPDRLPGTLDALAGLGEERRRTVGSEDVTEQVADLDSRLATQRASVVRVRALLSRATRIGDVVALESELAEREAALESLQARVRAVRGTADLATVTLVLTGQGAVAATASPGLLSGLDAGADAFAATARLLLVAAGAALPFLPLVLGGMLLSRRRRRRPVAT